MYLKKYVARTDSVDILRDLIFIVGAVYITYALLGDYVDGGHNYRQGDWLINGVNQDVRRGYFGSALIYFSDFLGANPLLILVMFQIALVWALFFHFRQAVDAVKTPIVGYLLAVSPGMFPVFWLVDAEAAARKEVIAFAGLALFAAGILNARRSLLALGAVLLAGSFWAHEATIFLMPAFLAIAAISLHITALRRWLAVASVTVSVSACLAFFHALAHSHIPDVAGICEPLLERGLDKQICSGAIDWLRRDLSYAWECTADKVTFREIAEFFLAYLFALTPLAFVISRLDRRKSYIAFAILSAVPFVLLCFIAIDWGRWVSMHVFSLSIFLVVAIGGGREKIRHPIRVQKPADIILAASVSVLFFLFAPPYLI